MLENSHARIYFNNIHYHSRFESKYGESAKALEDLVKEYRNKTERVILAVERFGDICYIDDGIHLTNNTLRELRGKIWNYYCFLYIFIFVIKGLYSSLIFNASNS